MFKVVNLSVLLCSLLCLNAYSMDEIKAQASCKAAALKRYQTIRKDQYGSTTGMKVDDIQFHGMRSKGMTRDMGYGDNYLTMMSVWMVSFLRGNAENMSRLDVNCITNEKDVVIGMEIDFRN